MKTSQENQEAGQFLASMEVVKRNLQHAITNGDKKYDPAKAMSADRSAKVIEVCRSLSRHP